MFLLRWDFALIALAVTPFLAVFVVRVNKAVRAAVRDVRTQQSELVATLQEGLQAIEVVQAFSREDLQERQLRKVSMETVTAWLKRAQVLVDCSHPWWDWRSHCARAWCCGAAHC